MNEKSRQYTGDNWQQMLEWGDDNDTCMRADSDSLIIDTLDGEIVVHPGQWVVIHDFDEFTVSDAKPSEGEMKEETQLKDCPFCGRTAYLQVESDHHGEFFSLGCGVKFHARGIGSDEEVVCPGHVPYYTEPIENLKTAIERWNTRTAEKA